MFDNFGMGEFFFLALLALLFFGPERLPQIGAQIGKWIARLTQYSKSFMNEWREEALAIHDAVEEVRGIRDEIAAARAEISSTLDTARGDLTEGIDAAKDAVTGARMDITNRLTSQRQEAAEDLERMAREERGEALPDQDGQDAAISRTQEILDGLKKKREETASAQEPTEVENDAGPEDAPETEPSVSEAEADLPKEGASDEDEWAHIRELIETGLSPAMRTREDETSGKEDTEPVADKVTEPETAEVEMAEGEDDTGALAQAAEQAPEPPRETAFDRSQKILEDLKKRRAGIPVEEPKEEIEGTGSEGTGAEGAEPETAEAADDAGVLAQVAEQPAELVKATAFDRSQQILEDLKKRRGRPKASSAAEQETADGGADVATETSSREFQELAAQVVNLQDEIAGLRRELEVLRDLSTRSAAERDEVSVEEAA